MLSSLFWRCCSSAPWLWPIAVVVLKSPLRLPPLLIVPLRLRPLSLRPAAALRFAPRRVRAALRPARLRARRVRAAVPAARVRARAAAPAAPVRVRVRVRAAVPVARVRARAAVRLVLPPPPNSTAAAKTFALFVPVAKRFAGSAADRFLRKDLWRVKSTRRERSQDGSFPFLFAPWLLTGWLNTGDECSEDLTKTVGDQRHWKTFYSLPDRIERPPETLIVCGLTAALPP